MEEMLLMYRRQSCTRCGLTLLVTSEGCSRCGPSTLRSHQADIRIQTYLTPRIRHHTGRPLTVPRHQQQHLGLLATAILAISVLHAIVQGIVAYIAPAIATITSSAPLATEMVEEKKSKLGNSFVSC